jgi:hypothetical protein
MPSEVEVGDKLVEFGLGMKVAVDLLEGVGPGWKWCLARKVGEGGGPELVKWVMLVLLVLLAQGSPRLAAWP